ncbi:bifunctional UDP-N-acetylglucosamine diphosphorylase/glucosamine-1-phosphate N-acetyltransferase GlmU [Alphaproteobacteria bacterium]|nr:bifunctional UDP-N-acetylglucosamine diphosphorylase/glucosamine-1-phosphate N-acetyltransferase GlmU [Alphaproteobacteria bacterium]
MKIAAIILAAGKGTRMKSALPKPLHAVGGRPMLAWALDAALAGGAETSVTILPPDSKPIQDWLDGGAFAIQQKALGTGHAVQAAADHLADFDGVALIMFADTPLITAETLRQLAALVADGSAVGVLGFETDDPTGYGRIVTDHDGSISGIVEENDATPKQRDITLVNGGIMAVRTPLLFDLLAQVSPDNAKGEIYLTDIIAIARKDGQRVSVLVTHEDEVIGVNDRVDLAIAEASLQDRLRVAALDNGVTMRAPDTVFLHADAIIEQDVVIEPHVIIDAGCHIGEGSIIRAFSHLEGATLGACCIIGPYARLRPGTHAGDGVKIGNFVEVKNTELGAGSKANHLTYLGDAEIGDGVNVGAGTITCNYDGYNKYKTLIGDGAFIGSNSSLVAPVSIGAHAIIGAGSVINADIPGDALGLARAPIDIRPDGAKKLHERNAAIKAGTIKK